ncbi:hypothetical protein CONPUDRAFT_166277 [Coniophora puteana RWD-64-598 SS2]|uniref:F-box domain-containing protein n=1 Tax=Coniophora puteana (strain RWD-64-598) TaxID=741705 RepID=A0A5M3MLS3_CONPW|nr:uncharacterized protein CONPUDRAFT_166277 [Coniophora puteana RWD-64-598 SS2]EIW79521.1 hypothetical protein CONPUDRAFT_166277 [Coniophora puteana RWD-64-598 SS2]
MHPCLRLPEVLSIILEFVHVHEEDACRTLAAAARTCKPFKEPALDKLYREISMLDVLKVLPEDLLEVKRAGPNRFMTFRRAMVLSDWRILERYVSRVRSLVSSDSTTGNLAIDKVVMSSLSSFCGAHLFPNVQRVEAFDSFFQGNFLPLAFGPRVIEVEFGNLPTNGAHTFTLLSQACPSLETISIIGGVDLHTRRALPNVLSDAVSLGFQKLKTFKIGTRLIIRTPSELFPFLSSLPCLEELAFYITPLPPYHGAPPILQPTRLFAFPSLQRLTLDYGGSKEVTSFMCSLSDLKTMTSLRAVLYSGSIHVGDTVEMLQILTKILPADNMLSLKLTHCFDGPVVPGLLDLLTFRRIYKFKNLTKLSFNLICSPEMNNSFIQELSAAFPKLESLSFYTGPLPPLSNHITMTGLATLLSGCPNLYHISLIVDFTTANNAAFDASPPTACNSRINRTCFAHSPIDDPAFVARHLVRMFPRLSDISPHPVKSFTGDCMWQKVETIVRKAHSARVLC